VWTLLRRKLVTVADHIHLIVSPAGEQMIREQLERDIASGFVSLSIQAEPIGMGDAIFCGYATWSQAQTALVVWGDQVFVSKDTLANSLLIHAQTATTLTLPLTQISSPYVEYIFRGKNLHAVKQSREGDACSSLGLSDVGTFIFSVEGIRQEWNNYLTKMQQGALTGEINFLPFLPFLSASGWQIKQFRVADTIEARGINTPEDITFFKTNARV
jgi:bifunctional UDP-N-acetylglucosamine pyrophosphorylase/glucosamine-1-phosphate N-acetyltransferase